MPTVPIIDATEKLLNISIEGLTYDITRDSFHVKTEDKNKVTPPYYENSHSD